MQSLFVPSLALILAATVLGAPAASADPPKQAPAAAAPATPSAKEGVDAVQKFYDANQSYKARFTQTFFAKAHNLKKESVGSVTFKKPGKMSWTYENPKGNRVVSNGSKVWVFEATQNPPQMWEQEVDRSAYPAALSFLLGGAKLAEQFNFEIHPGEKPGLDFPGGYVLVGTPKQDNPAYKKVLFYVDRASAQVRRVMILDGQGNKNRFDFSAPEVNLPVADGQFQFTPPPGTITVKPNERR
jgi:outer membrane lipoprotein carrier protein